MKGDPEIQALNVEEKKVLIKVFVCALSKREEKKTFKLVWKVS